MATSLFSCRKNQSLDKPAGDTAAVQADRAASLRFSSFLIVLITAVFMQQLLLGQEADSLRIRAGVELFPSFIAADLQLNEKIADDDTLHIAIIYQSSRQAAQHATDALKGVERIRNTPITISQLTIDQLSSSTTSPFAGIFIAEPLKDIAPLINFSSREHVLLFSPFEGDVARGATGGIFISDRILPYLNAKSLNSAGIHIKPFFHRVAKHYDH